MLRLLLSCVLLVCASCTPKPPEKERPVEPQAAAQQDGLGNGATGMPSAIQVPVDRARKIQDDLQKAEQTRKETLEKAEGG